MQVPFLSLPVLDLPLIYHAVFHAQLGQKVLRLRLLVHQLYEQMGCQQILEIRLQPVLEVGDDFGLYKIVRRHLSRWCLDLTRTRIKIAVRAIALTLNPLQLLALRQRNDFVVAAVSPCVRLLLLGAQEPHETPRMLDELVNLVFLLHLL